MIGVLLVVVAIVLAIETKSLLLGEAASLDAQDRITTALESIPGIDRIIHMKTLHLGPDELLVGAKIAVDADSNGRTRRDRRSTRPNRPSAPPSPRPP